MTVLPHHLPAGVVLLQLVADLIVPEEASLSGEGSYETVTVIFLQLNGYLDLGLHSPAKELSLAGAPILLFF